MEDSLKERLALFSKLEESILNEDDSIKIEGDRKYNIKVILLKLTEILEILNDMGIFKNKPLLSFIMTVLLKKVKRIIEVI